MSGTYLCRCYRPRVYVAFFLLISGILLSACAASQQDTLIPDEGMALGADARNIAKLKLTLVEKETQIKALQKKYDEAVQEVVRAKAKLHSLESKAEAASNMAEAEIALRALRTAGHTDGPEVIQAEHLLKMSAQEFKKHNYGGALYLASQAKGLVNIGRGRLMGREKIVMVSGEVLFALPLPLRVLAKSNVREGPGRDFEVLFRLEKGTPLFGHSYKDEWVRVKDADGRGGWIYQTLVGER